jgi:two-component system response regulator FixJ
MKPCIFIVDDEAAVRDSLSSVLATYGFETLSFGSARQALQALDPDACDCMLLDVRMPDTDGLMALKCIAATAAPPPVIMITGHADVPMAVQSMKLGAADFIEKPIVDDELVEKIRSALERSRRDTGDLALARAVRERYASLTPREQAVASLVSEGYATAAIAATLGISTRTVDHHRAAILAKMQATSLPQLLKFLLLIPHNQPPAS